MLTYTGRRNLFATLVNNDSSEVLASADQLMNSADKEILTAMRWPFLERQFTTVTAVNTQAYLMPANVSKVWSPYVTIGTIRYMPKEVTARSDWDELNQVTYSSNIPEWWYFYDSQIQLLPIPVNGGNTLTANTKRIPIDLTIADYTSGQITSATNGSAVVLGSSTSWTAGMVGMYIRITAGTAANQGDGLWYEVASVQNTGQLTLVRAYSGVSVSGGGTAYTLGQSQLYPEGYHELPVYSALGTYFTSVEPDAQKAALYGQINPKNPGTGGKSEALFNQMKIDTGSKTDSRVLSEGIYDEPERNPNLYITG